MFCFFGVSFQYVLLLVMIRRMTRWMITGEKVDVKGEKLDEELAEDMMIWMKRRI